MKKWAFRSKRPRSCDNAKLSSNQINVIVSAWSLENLNKLTYRYRFGNKESQWLPVDENKISLNYLSYGHYELELQAREGLGRWSAKKQLLFNVEPKFYQNFWFYCVVAAIAIFGFFVILQLRTSLLRKRSLNLQKTVEARTQSLQESNEKLNELRLLEIKHNEVELARKEQMNLELEEAVLIKTEELNHQVSKRIKFENEMQNAQKGELMGHMAGGLAHDLGNMLAVVSLNTYQLRKMVESALPTRQRIFDWVDCMDQAIKFCGDMVPKFQSLGRKDEYNPVVIDLVTVLNDLVDLTRVAVPEGVEIIKNLVENELFIKADEAEFRQTILNLVINASDACQEKGAIEICSERVLINTQTKVCVSCGEEFSINGVCVSIKDQGIGIAQDSIGHIFEHFYTTKNNSGATGIGLAVVARCCHRANGHLTVKSKLGVGSEFKLYYPLVSSNRQKIDVIKKIEINSNEANVTKNNRVLLVEDSELLCMNIKRLMENVGIDVQTAFDGRQALDILEVDQQWDMVLTDYSMPNLNGAELVIEIRQQWPELKVVVMSGYPDENLDRVKDIVDGVLKKPFRPDDLLELLN